MGIVVEIRELVMEIMEMVVEKMEISLTTIRRPTTSHQ